MPFAIVCDDLDLDWPDGTAVLHSLSVAFNTGRTGLIGLNGSGKSTLLRVIARLLEPTSGSVHVSGTLAYLPQQITRETGTVGDLLGVTAKRAALQRIETGVGAADDFDTVGEDWDIEDSAAAALTQFGIHLEGDDPLDRPLITLSGGEAVQAALAGCWLQRPDVLLLDEPTNNLDRAARERLYDAISSWNGVAVVVSHDRELLDLMDYTCEIRGGATRTHSGNWSSYREMIAAEQEAAQRMVRVAETGLKREKRQLIEAHTALDRRLRFANKAEEEKRVPKIISHGRKREAQVSAGKHRILQTGKVTDARETLNDASEQVRDDARIRVALPDTAVPAGRTVLELRWSANMVTVRGPERIALVGPNGSGKTTLLNEIVGLTESFAPHVRLGVQHCGYLPQRLDLLDDQLSVLQNLHSKQPAATPNAVRAGLARFLLRGDRVDQPAGSLSGGERFRATLAMLLLADPAPQLLLLDEPTNSLDLDSAEQLASALSGYRGALIVASHDLAFIESIGVQRFWSLQRTDGRTVLTDSPAGSLGR